MRFCFYSPFEHLVPLQVSLLEGLVWFPSDDAGWLKGKVLGAPRGSAEKATVTIEVVPRKFSADIAGQQHSGVPVAHLLPVSELDDPDIVSDVLDLHNVHDAAVFDTLRLRYFNDLIYTQARSPRCCLFSAAFPIAHGRSNRRTRAQAGVHR